MKEDYIHIFYRNCPHFTVGKVDQWGEHGYLFYEGKVYEYYEDRKDQHGKTYNPREIDEFLVYAKLKKIEISDSFKNVLADYKL